MNTEYSIEGDIVVKEEGKKSGSWEPQRAYRGQIGSPRRDGWNGGRKGRCSLKKMFSGMKDVAFDDCLRSTWFVTGSGGFRFGSRERLAFVLIFAIHLAIVVPLAATLNIWIDEAYSLRTTGSGLHHAVQASLGFELQPPLYFVVLTLWRLMDDSLFFARLFSIICTALTVLLSGGLARRYLPGVPPTVVAAVVAFNPLTVYAAVEARYYAMALLLSALMLWFFHDAYVANGQSGKARIWYTASAIAALYTYYFLGFLLAGGGAALVAINRRAVLRQYVLDMTISALVFAPLAGVTWRQVIMVDATGVEDTRTAAQGATEVWHTAWRQLLPVNQDDPLAPVRGWISRLAVPLLLVGVLTHRRLPTSETVIPLAFAGTVSLFFVWITVHLGPEFTRPQHTIVLYFPILFAALALLNYAGSIRAAVLASAVSVVFSGIYLMQSYAPMAKQGDWARVAQYIEEYESPMEPVLVFKAEYVLALEHHYSGRNVLIPLPKATSRERYDLAEQVLRGEDEIVGALAGKLGPEKQFWVVSAQTQLFRGIDFHEEILEEFIAQRCRVVVKRAFFGSRVRLLQVSREEGGGVSARGRIDDFRM